MGSSMGKFFRHSSANAFYRVSYLHSHLAMSRNRFNLSLDTLHFQLLLRLRNAELVSSEFRVPGTV